MISNNTTPALNKISQDDLDKRIHGLLTRYHAARRMNMNPAVIAQLETILAGLQEEKNRRLQEQYSAAADADPVVIDTDRGLI